MDMFYNIPMFLNVQKEEKQLCRYVNMFCHVPRNRALSEYSPVELEQDVVQTLLLRAFLGQLQDLGAAAEQLAGVACSRRRLHLVACQDPNLHPSLVQ